MLWRLIEQEQRTHLLLRSSENVRPGAFARRPHGLHGGSPQQVSDQIQLEVNDTSDSEPREHGLFLYVGLFTKTRCFL